MALGQLLELSIRPEKLSGQIENLLGAWDKTEPSPPTRLRQRLAALAVIADFAAIISGSWWRFALSSLVCFVLIRLSSPIWELPPGPWWTWSLLLGFDWLSMLCAATAVTLLVVPSTMLCRDIGRRIHAELNASTTSYSIRPSTLGAAVLLTAALLGSCALNRASESSACGSNWQPRALGQDWWLLLCPDGGCKILRDDEAQPVVDAGYQIIVPAAQLQRIDFLPNPRSCASAVHLVGAQKPTAVAVSLEREGSATTTSLSLDAPTLMALHELTDAFAQFGKQSTKKLDVKVDVSGKVKAELPSPPAAGSEIVEFRRLIDHYAPLFLRSYASANATAEHALRLKIACETRRRAKDFGQRVGSSVGGDRDCLDEIERSAKPSAEVSPPRPPFANGQSTTLSEVQP